MDTALLADGSSIDQLQLAFDPAGLAVLNAILGLVMFGVALDLRLADLAALVRVPRAAAVGLVSQFLLLPALGFMVASALAPTPSMALGIMLVAACPGGNISNFLTSLAGGRVGLSVGMTAVSTLAAVVATPLNLAFWGSLSPTTAPLVTRFSLDPIDLAGTLALLLLLPVSVGMLVNAHLPGVAAVLRKPFKVGSLLFFAAFVAIAFAKNLDAFVLAIGLVCLPVLVLNGAALALGYGAAALVGLPEPDRRAIAIEVGIQNSGLGLVIVFTFFGGLGGMAVVSAWWGIWHILAGLALASAWVAWDRRRARAVIPLG